MEIFLNGVKTPTQASTLSELIAEQSIATAGLDNQLLVWQIPE